MLLVGGAEAGPASLQFSVLFISSLPWENDARMQAGANGQAQARGYLLVSDQASMGAGWSSLLLASPSAGWITMMTVWYQYRRGKIQKDEAVSAKLEHQALRSALRRSCAGLGAVRSQRGWCGWKGCLAATTFTYEGASSMWIFK